jgi:hypothetical protein
MSPPRVIRRTLLPNCDAAFLLQEIARIAAQYGPDIASRTMGAASAAMEAESDKDRAMALLDLFALTIVGASGVARRRTQSNAALAYSIKRLADTSPGRFAHRRPRDNLEAAVEKIMVGLPDKPTRGRGYAQRVREALPPDSYRRKGKKTKPSVDTVLRCVCDVLEKQGRV